MQRIVITGGAGFIGSNFVHHLHRTAPDAHLVVFDALTYAGNRENLAALEGDPRFTFVQGDIRTLGDLEQVIPGADAVVHFAAESHVDRSIVDASDFLSTNIAGTYNILDLVKRHGVPRMVHVSTDEVYGSCATGEFSEEAPLNPSSPYAASKASSDLLALAHHTTFGTPVMITRSSNNFGPYQYPEKLIPLFITNALEDKPLPLYGDGLNVRDWLYVEDNCAGIAAVLHSGRPGEAYNIGADNQCTNRDITRLILRILDKPETLITLVSDRLGHDRRYAIGSEKIKALGWAPRRSFQEALDATVRWYLEHEAWWRAIKNKQAEYQKFMTSYYDTLKQPTAERLIASDAR